jgi:hypothetical protein
MSEVTGLTEERGHIRPVPPATTVLSRRMVQSPRIFLYKMTQPGAAHVVNESTVNHFTVLRALQNTGL